MRPPSAPDDRLAEVVERLAGSPFHRSAGIELVAAEAGAVEVSMVAGEDHRNLFGSIHGGVLATLADTAMGLSVLSRLEPGRTHVTTSIDVHFLSAAAPGILRARGRAVRVGRRTSYAEADVIDGSDRLLARAAATFVEAGAAPRDQ